MRRLIALLAGILLALTLLAAPAAAQGRNPVIFVHGWLGNSGQWDDMIDDFVRAGWNRNQLYAIDYVTTVRSNEDIARTTISPTVDRVLRETGAREVDLVTHSMGGLNTRWYIKFLGGDANVGNWVSLGGPNNGTTTAGFCDLTFPSCRDMARRSDFLRQLNAGNPTPGSVNYATWWSSCDLVITPNSSVRLSGANNNRAGCVGHLALMSNNSVSRGVRGFLS